MTRAFYRHTAFSRIVSTVVAAAFILSLANLGYAAPQASTEPTPTEPAATDQVSTPAEPEKAVEPQPVVSDPGADPGAVAPVVGQAPDASTGGTDKSVEDPVRTAEPFSTKLAAKTPTVGDGITPAVVTVQGSNLGDIVEGYRLTPTSQKGWANSNLGKDYREGQWVPWRLVLGPNGAATQTVSPATIQLDYRNGTTIGFDATRNWTYYTTTVSPKSGDAPGVPSGSAPTIAYKDSVVAGGGGVDAYLETQISNIVVPPNGYAVVYFQAHLALTGYWRNQTPAYMGSAFYSGSSLQVGFVEGGKQRVQLPLPPEPSGTLPGLKFNDYDHDGVQDTGEPGLAGWHFHMETTYDGYFLSHDATSAADGTFSIPYLIDGTWTLTEFPQAGWTNSTPLPMTVVISNGMITSVNGVAWVNGTPVKVGNYVPDVTKTFRLTVTSQMPNADSYFVRYTYTKPGQSAVTTDLALASAGGGVYEAAVSFPYGTVISSWQFFAKMGSSSIALTALRTRTEPLTEDITNPGDYTPGVISGYKKLDADRDGALGAGDTPGAGWTINLYRGGVLYATTSTGADGSYTFGGLLPGTYTVSEVEDGNYTRILPAGANEFGPFTISSGSTVNSGTTFLNQPKLASIEITKTGPVMAHPGDVIDYEITVQNTGLVTLTNVTITDPLFDPDLVMNIGTLAPGQTFSTTVPYTVPAGAVGAVDNTATVTAGSFFGLRTDWDDWTVKILRPAIDVTKVANPTKVTLTEASPSKPVTYTITITNTGDATLTIDANDYVEGIVRHDLTPTLLTLGPGAHEDYEVSDQISVPTTDTVVAIGTDVLGGPKGTVEDSATAHVDVDLVKTFELTFSPTVPAADRYFAAYVVDGQTYEVTLSPTSAGSLVYTGTATFPYGTEITSWQFFAEVGGVDIPLKPAKGPETLLEPITNDETYTPGSVAGKKYIDVDRSGSITASDTMGAGWTINLYRAGVLVGTTVTNGSGAYSFANLLPGSYTVREVMDPAYDKILPAGAELGPYTVSSGSAVTDANFLNRPKLVSIDVEKYSVTQAHVGDTIQYFIRVTNSGEATLTNVVVSDPLFDPDLGYTIPVLSAGAYVDIPLALTDYVVPNVSQVDNLVTASGTGPFGTVNDTDVWTVDVLRPAIDVSKVANPTKVTLTEASPSKPVTYTITITNTGDATLTIDANDYVEGIVRHDLTPTLLTLGPGAHEDYEVSDQISVPTTDTVVAIGTDVLGGPKGTVEDSATAHVDVDLVKTFELTLSEPVAGATGYGVTYVKGGVSTDLALVYNASSGAYEAEITVPFGTVIDSWTFWALIGGQKYALLPTDGPETLEAPVTNPGEFDPGVIAGKKYIDADDSGSITAGDTMGAGWAITLYRNGQSWATTTTGADGSFSFSGLIPGTYTLSETLKNGYIQISAPGEYRVVSGTDISNANFLNRDLDVSVHVDKSSVTLAHVGDTIQYDITVTNSGETTLTNVVVYDPLFDPDLDYTIPLLAPGQSVDVPVALTDYVVPDVDYVDNTVYVSGDGPFGTVEDDDDWTVDVLRPAIDVTKVANPTKVTLTEASPSKPVTYTITITNTGDATLTIDAADYVEGLVRFDLTPTLITLGPGAHEDFEVSEFVSAPTTDTANAVGTDVLGGPKGTVEDSATAHVDVDVVKTFEMTLGEPIPAADSFGVTYEIDGVPTDLALASQGGGVYSATITVPYGTVIDSWFYYAVIDGEHVTLSVTGGPETLEGPMTNPFHYTPGEISGMKWIDIDRDGELGEGDDPGAGWEITLYRDGEVYDTATTGADGTFGFTGLVPGDYSLDETMQQYYVMVYGPDAFTVPLGGLGAPGAEQGDQQFVLRGLDFLNQPEAPSIDIVKSVDKPAVINGDGEVVYMYTITNDGDVPLSEVALNDDKLGTITLPQSTLDVGESIVVTVPATLDVTTENLGTVTAVDEWGTDVSDEDTALVVVYNPSIDITKTVAPGVVLAGETVVYTYTVQNTGDITLRDVTVTDDQLPEFLANLGDMAPGASAEVTTSAPISVDTTNVATATGDVREVFQVPGAELPYILEGSVSATDDAFVDVIGPAIDVEKSADATGVIAGDTVTYTYVVTNVGDVDLFDVVLDDDRLGVIDTLDSLLVGESATRTASAVLTVPTTNTVTATGYDRMQHEVTDEDTVFVDVAPPFTPGDIAVKKSADATVAKPGQLVKYTVTVWNTGGDPIPSYTLVDDFDQRYATVVDAAGGTVNTSDGTITWTVDDPLYVEDGERSITYTVRIKSSMPTGTTNVDNVVVVTAPGDRDPDNNRSTWRVKVTVSEPFLPFTGSNLVLLIALAVVAAAVGFVLRRMSRA